MNEQLLSIIHDVRRRWRAKLLVRGAALTAACGGAALVLAASGLQWMRFTPQSILVARIVIGVVFALLAYLLLARPLMRRVTDEQVAMYLEEHEPSLEVAIISAIEAERTGLSKESPALVRRLIESAIERCRTVEEGRRVERLPLRRYAGGLGAALLIAGAIFMLGPSYMRHALSALLVVSRSVEAAAPYRIEVKPGNATVPRGADLAVSARLVGFQSEQASLMIRKSKTAAFERLPLIRGEGDQYDGTLFDVNAPIEYFVEAVGVRSPVFSLNVADMPYVQRLELEYVFPAYTGLQPRKIDDGGDIAVIRGTEIHVRAIPTMAADGGAILIDDKTSVPLTVSTDGSLLATFTADHDGFYRIELDAPHGPKVDASPKYSIDVLADQPPAISFTKPGRDTSASPIEEVFLEAKAEDDYGIGSLDLVYSVNGGPEKTVKLFNGSKRMTAVSAGHTLYLEELEVKPGDSISYYARAFDNNSVGGQQKGTSDLYFLRVRPLQKDFHRAESQAGAGGGGGDPVGQLSQQERQIIAATFNIQRDRKGMSAPRLKESSVVVALMQKRLREQVSELVQNFATRVGDQAERFRKITDFLKQSVPEMQTAENKLQGASPDAALAPEQHALEFLQKAEEEYELQVSASRNQGGGGGGGDKMAEELADLFELEVDRMANQYETAERAAQQQADQKIDELAEKLKELARRQEQEAERQRRRAASGQGSGGGDTQRALADQAEEAARQLEKLAREENRPEAAAAARRLQQAADAMRQAAANGDPNAAAQAASATEQLRAAERQLQQAQSARTGRDLGDAVRQAEALAREQQGIQKDVNELDAAGNARGEKVQQLSERKQSLAGKVDELEKQLDRSAGTMFKDEREASRKLTEAANGIRDKRIEDKIRYSDQMLRAGGQPSDVSSFERDIQSNLDDLRQKVGDAASAVGRSKADATTQALDKARQLAQGMESLGERMRSQRGQQGQNGEGQQGQRGQQGDQQAQGQQDQNGRQGQQNSQQGPPGQNGQQGQQGQNGRSGQQGQQGQEGQQGQQGQGQQGGNGGRNTGDPTQGGRAGEGDTRGGQFRPDAGALGDSRPGGARFSSDDIRQFRGEVRQRAADAEQLRRMLKDQKIDAKDLDEILRGLRQLDSDSPYQNPEALARLEGAVTSNIKRFEYMLRRRLDSNANQVFLSGSDDVPEQYRKLVEQYYRSLSKGGAK
jgi:hypothetical protein